MKIMIVMIKLYDLTPLVEMKNNDEQTLQSIFELLKNSIALNQRNTS